MLNSFLEHLRAHRIPVSLREHLDLQHLFLNRLISVDVNEFYYLSRLCLIKDEKYFDRFDKAFAAFFDSLAQESFVLDVATDLPWFKQQLTNVIGLTAAAEVEREIQHYKEQVTRQKNGALSNSTDASSIDESGKPGQGKGEAEGEGEGEGGTEGEGSDGDVGEGHSSKSAEGVRDDSNGERQHSATKVWELRSFEEYDPDVELGTRNIKMALRRLRKFARTSSLLELDLAATIRSTAKQAGLLDIVEVPERHNSVKVLLLLDVGGSMDEFAILCEQLFSAASSEFKYMEIFYFHNIFYESLWTSSTRSPESRVKTIDVLRKYGSDYKIIIVGDGNMARHEIAEKGGSVERYNPESGELWLQRFQESFRKIVWLNPTEESRWLDVYTIQMLRRLMPGQMFHLSVSGIEQAMKKLTR
ncbi:MAG: VWA domain-containing protein [Pseudomonadales bacterium]|nr:VWA domain-containing protein [Pseudomonadales bacterium]